MANLLDLKLKRPKPFTSKNNFETLMTMNSFKWSRENTCIKQDRPFHLPQDGIMFWIFLCKVVENWHI